jgi:hypothetical protein
MLIYKVVPSKTGIKELEKEVSILLNKGWKPVGSISFNQGYCYQAMVGKIEKKQEKQKDKKECQILEPKELGTIDAMKKIDELT